MRKIQRKEKVGKPLVFCIMQGTVKWFNAVKGYGFVICDDGRERFVHQTEIQMEGFRKLKGGQRVEFDTQDTAAVNVRTLE